MGSKGGLFRYADGVDKFLVFFGTLACIGDGLQTPLTMLVLGSLIDDYASGSQQSVSNHTINKYALRLLGVAFGVALSAFIGRANGGIIARNSLGVSQFMQASSFLAQSPLIAETLVIREAMVLAANLGCRRIVVESDNLQAIQACRGMTEYGEIKGIVADIRIMAAEFEKCGFTWTARAGNGPAHKIADLQRQGRWNQACCFSPPLAISSLLLFDQVRMDSPGVT